MKPLSDLKFGFSDAENYRRRENKELFNRMFLRTDALDKLCDRSTSFLIGEKGTGKTAYAVFLSNSPYKDNVAFHKFIRETDYHKFIALKRANNLSLSEYSDIWMVILCLLMCDSVSKRYALTGILAPFSKFKALQDAVDEYYSAAFSPEIPTALKLVENSGDLSP